MATPIIGTVIGERWRVTDLLGRGGFGQVFACHDESDIALGDAAVKLLHANTTPMERSEFLGEVKQMAKLRHQNLVGYLDSGLHRLGDDVHPFLVTERCAGSLADHLTGGEAGSDGPSAPVVPHRAAAVLADVLAGLVHLHDRQLVHRDIKPANVLWGDGAWKLADFGLMRQLTATGSYHKGDQVVGTPRFMAPELFTTGRATAATDVYAVGVLAHVLLTGRATHQGSGMALVHAITSTPPTIDQALAPGWVSWIASAVDVDVEARPSARDLLSALETIADGAEGHDLGNGNGNGNGNGGAPGPAPSTVAVRDQPIPAWAPPSEHSAPDHPTPVSASLVDDRSSVGSPARRLAIVGGLGLAVSILGVFGWLALRGDGGVDQAEISAVAAADAPSGGEAGPGVDTDPDAGSPDGSKVEIGDEVEIGDGVEIGSSGAGDGSGGAADQEVSPPEQHVAAPPCSTGVVEQILITNPDVGHRDYRIEINHQDADGVRVDEHIALLKAVAPGETVSAGVVPREEGVVACTVATFDVSATPPSVVEAVDQVEIRECAPDNGWHDVVFDVTNPNGDRSVDAEVYVAVIDGDGVRLDEDWAGSSVYDIGPGETVRADDTHVFWNVDALGGPEVTCRIVAVEFE